jgi:hypothetical protein
MSKNNPNFTQDQESGVLYLVSRRHPNRDLPVETFKYS